MMPHTNTKPIGMLLREARNKKGLKQLEVANWLGVSEKTLRNYENGEFLSTDIHILQRIALKLEIEPEQLGLSRPVHYTYEEAKNLLEKGEANVIAGDFTSAYHIGDVLTRNLTTYAEEGKANQETLDLLSRAHFLAGHTSTIIRESRDVSQAFAHFKSMEDLARLLDDETLLTIALTYQGEMLRRDGKLNEAIRTIEAAPHGPLVDIAAKGNRSQLLARAFASQGNLSSFREQMLRAEELASQSPSGVKGIYIPYNLGSVYEEYARVYAQRGNIKEGKRYIDLTEAHIPQIPRWITLTKLTKGEVLLRAVAKAEQKHPGNVKHIADFQNGLVLIREATKLARKHSHQRLLRRAYMLKTTFLNEATKFHLIATMLAEAIESGMQDEQAMSDEY